MSWPAPARDAALHGIAGEFVTRTAPHTESDPMALLIQFLVAVGAAAGRNVHYPVEASRHHLNEYAILIGPSGKGRKGSAWDHVDALVSEIDSTFAEQCISSGLASGEGLIFEVRDPSPGDNGASDKRRLIIEAEFAQILKVLARDGNTLSPVVRNAWDGKPLQTIAKNAPVRATGAHVAIIGHITKDELLRFVSGTELANGFVNRNADPAGMPTFALKLPADSGVGLDQGRHDRVRDLRGRRAAGRVVGSVLGGRWVGWLDRARVA